MPVGCERACMSYGENLCERNKYMIGIIGAMELEVEKLKAAMTDTREIVFAGMNFVSGKLCGKDVVVVRSGVGKVNAAICTQLLIDRFSVDEVWNTGIAGSLDAAINIGDFVISTEAVQHDVDAVYFGYGLGVIPQMKVSFFPADPELSGLAERVSRRVNPELSVFRGRVLSGDQFIADRNKKEWLKENFRGLCTEMEGAAIAQTAYLNGIPFLIIRAISDKADDSATEDSSVFEQKAGDHMAGLLLALVKER